MSFRTAEGKVKVVIAVDGSARVVKKPEGFSQKWAEHAAKTDASLAEVWRNPQAPKIKPEDLFLSKKFSTVQNNEGTVVSFEVHGLNGKLRGRAEVLFAPDGTPMLKIKPEGPFEEAVIGRAASYLARQEAKAKRIAADQRES